MHEDVALHHCHQFEISCDGQKIAGVFNAGVVTAACAEWVGHFRLLQLLVCCEQHLEQLFQKISV